MIVSSANCGENKNDPKKERKNILGGLFEFYKTKSMNWALHAVAKS